MRRESLDGEQPGRGGGRRQATGSSETRSTLDNGSGTRHRREGTANRSAAQSAEAGLRVGYHDQRRTADRPEGALGAGPGEAGCCPEELAGWLEETGLRRSGGPPRGALPGGSSLGSYEVRSLRGLDREGEREVGWVLRLPGCCKRELQE